MMQLDQMSQPDPQAQQMQQQAQQLQMGLVEAQANELNARAAECAADGQQAQARRKKLLIESSLLDEKAKIDLIRTLTANLNNKDKQEFDKRAKTAEILLKERDLLSNERIVDKQMRDNNA